MRVLIVKTSALGDILQTYPVVSYLKQVQHVVRIDWAVEAAGAELIQRHPDISHAHIIDSRAWRRAPLHPQSWAELRQVLSQLRSTTYDLVLDLQGNCKSACVTALARAPVKVGFGRQAVPELPNLLATNLRFIPPSDCNVRDRYLYLTQQAFSDTKAFSAENISLQLDETERKSLEELISLKYPQCIVCPGAAWPNKRLSPLQLSEGLRSLRKVYKVDFLLAWGTEEERGMAEDLQLELGCAASLLPRLSLPVLQGLMQRASAVIAMDSLPLHLCATTKTPCFGFFGASRAAVYAPQGKQHAYIQGVCPYKETFMYRCSKIRTCPTGACIRDISNESTSQALKNWWLSEVMKG